MPSPTPQPEDLAAEQRQPETAVPAVPVEDLRPVVPQNGMWPQTKALARYMVSTEVHTYAFSVAANAILSLFPFIVLLLTICRQVLHSRAMETVVADMMRSFLP